MPAKPHILFAGGGSLGCVYPALSVARRLRERLPQAEVSIAGNGRAIERHTVHAAGHRYVATPRCDAPRRLRDVPAYVLQNAAGWCVSNWLLRELEVSLVVSLGGHASGPLVRAAARAGVPFVLVEQGRLPAPTTQAHARHAAAVCLAHEESRARLPVSASTVVTGAIARPGFEDAYRRGRLPRRERPDGPRRLVVLGGVAGAASLNEAAAPALAQLGQDAAGWQIVHQSGAGWLTQAENRYREHGLDATVVSYVDELGDLASETDLVVCRPGGSTLAELALAGLPAVLAPDSRTRDGSQQADARLAAELTGCPVVDETTGDLGVSLAGALRPLMTRTDLRERLAKRMAALATPDASSQVASVCLETLGFGAAQTAPRLAAAA